jgi:hypothetical protein
MQTPPSAVPGATVQPLPGAPVSAAPAQAASATAAPSASADPMRTAGAPSGQVQGPPAPGFETVDRPASSPPAQMAQATPSPAAAPSAATVQAMPSTTPPTALAQAAPAAPTTAQPQPDPVATRTLADIIRAIDVPETERQTSVAAVNLEEVAALQAARRAERQTAAKLAADKARKDAAAKAKAEADAKAKKEAEEKKRLAANPSRNWLQVGVGQSKSALGFTMKRLRGKYAALAPQDAWSAAWSRTNRLLVGPFASFTRAKEMESKLKADGADVFAWKSDAGEVVERLGGD